MRPKKESVDAASTAKLGRTQTYPEKYNPGLQDSAKQHGIEPGIAAKQQTTGAWKTSITGVV
jgi:hypothetical protein